MSVKISITESALWPMAMPWLRRISSGQQSKGGRGAIWGEGGWRGPGVGVISTMIYMYIYIYYIEHCDTQSRNTLCHEVYNNYVTRIYFFHLVLFCGASYRPSL